MFLLRLCSVKGILDMSYNKMPEQTHLPRLPIRSLIFLIILQACIYNTASAQSIIKGSVITANQVLVPYAGVSLYKDSVKITEVVSDSSGNFSIHFPAALIGNLWLQAYYLKVTSPKVFLSGNTNAYTLVLEDKKNVLQEVIVNSSKPVFTRLADRFVFIPGKQLVQGGNGLDVLSFAPLVNYDQKSDLFSIVGKENTVILINNKKTTLPKAMIIDMLKALPAENIKSVEIITNPGSEYDANAAGGIININIKRQVYEGWLASVSLVSQQSVYNTTVFNANANYRKGKFAIQFSPTFSNNYNYYTRETDLYYPQNLQENQQLSFFRRYQVAGGGLTADYDINKRSFLSYKGWFTYVSGKSDRQLLTLFANGNGAAADSMQQSPLTGKDFYIYNFGNLNFHRDLTGNGEKYIDVNVDYNQFEQDNKNEGRFVMFDITGSPKREPEIYKNHLPQHFFNLSERVEYGQQFTNGLKLKLGVQYSNTSVKNDLQYFNWERNQQAYIVDNSLSNNYRYTETYFAGYLTIAKKVNKKMSANAGMRIEKTSYQSGESRTGTVSDTSYINLFPSVSLSYAGNPRNQLGISFSSRIRRPNIESLFPGRTYYNQNYFAENNPFLKPVLYYNTELSYTYNNKWTLTGSYSYGRNHSSSFVIPVIEDNIQKLKSTSLNYGKVRSVGLVLYTNHSFYKGVWQLQFTASYGYNQYLSNTPLVPVSISNHNCTIYISNILTISKKKAVTGFITFKYNSPLRNISSQTINATSFLDLAIRKTIQKRLSLMLFANDIYNGLSVIKRNIALNGILDKNYQTQNNYNWSFTVRISYQFGNFKVKKNKDRGIANDEIKGRT